MKTLMIFAVIFVIVMTALLLACKNEGLHPNFGAWTVMIPLVFLFVWAKGCLLKGLK